MKLWQLILLLGNCFHHWSPATADGTYRPIMNGSTLVNVEVTGNPINVNLSNLNIETIGSNAFDALTNVTVLDLSGNKFEEFPLGVFAKLNNLMHLDLRSHYLVDLKSGYFAGLPKFVNITFEPSSFISHGYFAYLRSKHQTSGPRFLKHLSTAVFKNASDLTPTVEDKEERPWTVKKWHSNTYRACITDDILEFCEIATEQYNRHCTLYQQFINEVSQYDDFILLDVNIGRFRKNWYQITDSKIKRITIAANRITEITPELINDLPSNIIEISFEYTLIETIKNGIANDNLRVLRIDSHELRTIEDESLAKLKLTELWIGINSMNSTKFIRALPATLEIFSFHGRLLREIPPNTFNHLKKLKILTIENLHKLTYLELGIFNGLENLEEINFLCGGIHELTPGLFTGLSQLSHISFYYHRIEKIHHDTFRGLNLSKLALPMNDLKIIEAGTFSNTSIKDLELSLNTMHSIEEGAFDGAHIMNIDLGSNRFKVFKKESLNGISGVKHFSLAYNPLEIIEKGSMLNLREARHVDLEFTRIRALENGMLFGLSTDNVDVIVSGAPIELIQGGIFDEPTEN